MMANHSQSATTKLRQKNYKIICDLRSTIYLFIENSFRTKHYFASSLAYFLELY